MGGGSGQEMGTVTDPDGDSCSWWLYVTHPKAQIIPPPKNSDSRKFSELLTIFFCLFVYLSLIRRSHFPFRKIKK